METRADSPIAGVSDDDGYDEEMQEYEEDAVDTLPVDFAPPDQCACTSKPADTNSESTTTDVVITGQSIQESRDSDLEMIPLEVGKRRASLPVPEEADEANSTKKARVLPDYSQFESISVKASNGNILFLPKIPPEAIPAVPAAIGGLLSHKMVQLSNQVALKRSARDASVPGMETNALRHRSSELWVNKYAPKSFLHLLSDEWLKSWDPIVFGKSAATRHSNSVGKDRESGSLPESKIMLLNGPPGVGKTTLVHILARQAGYMPMEINASDERSTSGLKSRLEALTETQSITITGASGRPICVILDEIDGTVGSEGQGVVGILLKLAQDHTSGTKKKKPSAELDTEEHADGENEDGEESADKPNAGALSKRRKVKAMPKVLRRPIICICNDLYATALRPLRPVVQIVKFSPPSSARLIARLQDICKGEGIKMNRQALTVLYEMHHGDIRACVTALQMISVDPALDGVMIDVANMRRVASMTSRDGGLSTGLFDVWTAIFDQSAGKKKDGATAGKKVESPVHEDSGSSLVRMLDAHMSDMSTILNGCHENYPSVKFTDPHIVKTVACLEALCEADCMQSRIQKHQQYSLMPYIPFAARRIHAACATSAQPNIEFPRSMTQNNQLQRERKSILESIRSNIHQHHEPIDGIGYQPARPSESILVTEFLPSLAEILNPSIKTGNMHVIGKEVREIMERHVCIMRGYGLSYKSRGISAHSDLQESTSTYRIEPDIEALAFISKHIEGPQPQPPKTAERPADVRVPRTTLSQELIKQMQHMIERGPVHVTQPEHNGSRQMGKHGAILTAKAVALPSEKTKSFGHAGWASASQHKTSRQSSTRPSLATAHPVKYKFNEGVTNAIKRPVLMRDLISV